MFVRHLTENCHIFIHICLVLFYWLLTVLELEYEQIASTFQWNQGWQEPGKGSATPFIYIYFHPQSGVSFILDWWMFKSSYVSVMFTHSLSSGWKPLKHLHIKVSIILKENADMEHQTTWDVQTVFHAVSQQKSLNAGVCFFHLLPDKLQAANYWNDGVVQSSSPLEQRVQCSEMKLLWYEARLCFNFIYCRFFSISLHWTLPPLWAFRGWGGEKKVFFCVLRSCLAGLWLVYKQKTTILSIMQQNHLLHIHAQWPCI